jgi:ubiquitin-protein ligase
MLHVWRLYLDTEDMVTFNTTTLITRLDDALALYDEPLWQELRTALTAAKRPSQGEEQKEWFRAYPDRLAREYAVLTKLITPAPDCTTLFFQNTKTKRLGATGLVNLTGRKRVKIEIQYPDDYPISPPRVFFFGPVLKKIPQLLREDGSVPVPFGADQQWTESGNSGIVLNWALEWLERTMKLETASAAQREITQLKPGWHFYGESAEEWKKRWKGRLPGGEETDGS